MGLFLNGCLVSCFQKLVRSPKDTKGMNSKNGNSSKLIANHRVFNTKGRSSNIFDDFQSYGQAENISHVSTITHILQRIS